MVNFVIIINKISSFHRNRVLEYSGDADYIVGVWHPQSPFVSREDMARIK